MQPLSTLEALCERPSHLLMKGWPKPLKLSIVTPMMPLIGPQATSVSSKSIDLTEQSRFIGFLPPCTMDPEVWILIWPRNQNDKTRFDGDNSIAPILQQQGNQGTSNLFGKAIVVEKSLWSLVFYQNRRFCIGLK